MTSESKKRVAELISQLGDYKEVQIVPIEKCFTITVNGQVVHSAVNNPPALDWRREPFYFLFQDSHRPYGKRISPHAFKASTAIPIGRARDNPTVKIAARTAVTIDGVVHTKSEHVTFGRKELEEAPAGDGRWTSPVIRPISASKFTIDVYAYKTVYYLCCAGLKRDDAEPLKFNKYYERLDDHDLKQIDELSASLSKRAKYLSDYTTPDPDSIAEGYAPQPVAEAHPEQE